MIPSHFITLHVQKNKALLLLILILIVQMAGVDIRNKLKQALGTMKDHASISKAMIYTSRRHHHDGKTLSDIEIAVVRATDHHNNNGPIDDKHMHEILFLVSNSHDSIPFLAEQISKRLAKTRDRLVALKTLFLIHRLLRGGNHFIEQQLRTAHFTGHLQINTFSILTRNSSTYCYTNTSSSLDFLQKYADYLEERVGWVINQAGKLEPATHSTTSKHIEFRCCSYYNNNQDEKAFDLVFRRLPKCQVFIDKVLNFCLLNEASSNNLDYLTQAALSNTLKESFQVYATFREGVAALIDMFFDLTTPARSLACDILRRVSRQSKKLEDMYEKCKRVVVDQRYKNLEYPIVEVIAMEHVIALDMCSQKSQSQVGKSIICSDDEMVKSSSDCDSTSLTTTTTLFSCTLETKISNVWVIFEDHDDDNNNVVEVCPTSLVKVQLIS